MTRAHGTGGQLLVEREDGTLVVVGEVQSWTFLPQGYENPRSYHPRRGERLDDLQGRSVRKGSTVARWLAQAEPDRGVLSVPRAIARWIDRQIMGETVERLDRADYPFLRLTPDPDLPPTDALGQVTEADWRREVECLPSPHPPRVVKGARHSRDLWGDVVDLDRADG